MKIARTLFGPRAPDGYSDGTTQVHVDTAVDEDENDEVFLPDAPEGLTTGAMARMVVSAVVFFFF